jgi:hypothetical protein
LTNIEASPVPGIGEAMIERIRWNWHHFASRTPGLRFRERFRLHQSRRRRSGFDIVRIFYIVGGALLIALSTVLGWLPLLGWGTAILGPSMIAAEFYAVALLMDRLEVRACELLGPLGKAFVRMPTWAQLWVSMLITESTITLVYGLYSLSLG